MTAGRAKYSLPGALGANAINRPRQAIILYKRKYSAIEILPPRVSNQDSAIVLSRNGRGTGGIKRPRLNLIFPPRRKSLDKH